MSDYLTRLIERSLGSAPQIEPLIAPLHAPSDQVLSERVEKPAEFETGPAARTETEEADTPPAAAITAESAGPPPSRIGSRQPQASIPLPESPNAIPVGKKDDRALPVQARPKAPLRQASSPRSPAAEVISASPGPPPSPFAAPVVSDGLIQTVVQPEIIEQLEAQTSPRESPQLPLTTAMASQRKGQIVVRPEIKPATAPSLPARQGLSKEPPAIHVTIGRIEVRAVHPPPEPVVQRPKPASPRISLDEYLKQRNGGRR